MNDPNINSNPETIISMEIIKEKHQKLRKTFDLLKIKELPDDMVNEIRMFIPDICFVFTNKENMAKYHHATKPILMKKNVFETYVRDIIRRDNDFIFSYILKENYNKWKSIKDYLDAYTIYPNYVVFLMNYCFTNHSDKCRIVLHNYIVECQKN